MSWRRRTRAEREAADAFHAAGRARNRGRCVKCGKRAGRWAHHAPERQWLRRHGVPEWDAAIAVPVTDDCHDRHTTKVAPITRGELERAGIWRTLVEWAMRQDEALFPGRQPVLSRLEREYPEVRR